MPEIQQIRTTADYEAALARISALLGAKPYSPDDAELDWLSDLVADYESEHFPIPCPSPEALLEFMQEQGILSRRQLLSLVGSASRLDAILAGQQPITPELAQLIEQHSGVPAAEPVAV